ncbi:MAG: GAF domain-containing sensor histidine kinase [Alphaproteobacteria bacterium]|nr:GAF domain-containing sensor histidine kinase [Alphaproteobacteria bacterium]
MEEHFQRDIHRLEHNPAVTRILDVVCAITGMRFAAVARVTEERWIALSVKDLIAFGVTPGSELEVRTTICKEVRDHQRTILIEHVAEDPEWRDHPTPKLYGLQSSISTPIIRANGEFFGTLCALDPEPRKVDTEEVRNMFELFAELIAHQLDTDDELTSARGDLLAANEAAVLRDQFIAVLGHDLRNPLNAVDAGARMPEREALTDSQRGVVRLMRASTLRMTGLVSNVLDFARGRLRAGIVLDKQRTNLGPALAQVVSELQAVWPEQIINTDITDAVPVYCDVNRIAQLASNLLANAITHGTPGTPIEIALRTSAEGAELTVCNVAAPISAEAEQNLFKPFVRGDSTQPGLGLGLYIAHEIARAHGGALGVASSGGQVRFKLTLPAAE